MSGGTRRKEPARTAQKRRRGGAAAPRTPVRFISQWLPSGATVNALRNAVYFPDYQHVHPIAVLPTSAAALFAAMVVASRLRTSPAAP